MRRSVKWWIIGICIGMCIPALIYLRLRPHYTENEMRNAQAMGEDVATYHDVRALYKQVFKTHRLSLQELEQAQSRLAHHTMNTRMITVTTLTLCDDPAVKPHVLALIRKGLTDQDARVRYKALIGLRRQHDPQLQSAAQQLAQDPQDYVREEALSILGVTAGSK
jgi:hypothetical protein